jgi:hypothetical protein
MSDQLDENETEEDVVQEEEEVLQTNEEPKVIIESAW